MTKICIIIPALNEEKTIGNIIKLSSNYGNTLVINDASNDGTKKIAIKNGATVLNNRSTLGYDESILKGIKYALKKKYDYILTIDADGQHPIELIPKFIIDFVDIKSIIKIETLHFSFPVSSLCA